MIKIQFEINIVIKIVVIKQNKNLDKSAREKEEYLKMQESYEHRIEIKENSNKIINSASQYVFTFY